MGALILKSFPFILRNWNVKSYNSIDITDSFGQEIRMYLNKNQIIKIEPQFSNSNSHVWLTDKGRQFFDSVFGKVSKTNTQLEDLPVKSMKQWEILFKNINSTFYVFDICNFKQVNKHFFVIVFENVSVETLNLLFLVSQTNSFIKLRRAENLKLNGNLESDFQVESATCTSKLSASSLCLLIGTNTRYEGSYLNLKLRQRYFKGNFKLLSLGSLTDITFPVSFLGSNMSSLIFFSEGNQIFCKDILNSRNPILITNSEVFKHTNSQEFLNIMKVFKNTNILNKVWNGHNVLNASLHETGIHNLTSFSFLTFKDLVSFSSFYMVNVNLNNISNLKKITESRLIHYKSSKQLYNKKLFLNQNFNTSLDNLSKFVRFKKYLYLPNNIFFETQETFINTEGFIKKTTKLISRKKTRNDWQLLRKFLKNSQISSLGNFKDNQIIFYNATSIFDFKNFINFQYYATQTLTNLNFYLNSSNKKFVIYKKFNKFKSPSVKIFNTKLKYWLDDFYTGGKDRFCQNSLTLTRCSVNYKLQTTNFFLKWLTQLVECLAYNEKVNGSSPLLLKELKGEYNSVG